MTTQEKQIKIAEIVGWINQGKAKGVPALDHRWVRKSKPLQFCDTDNLPPYTTSIDSIRAAVLAQSEEFQVHFQDKLLSRVYEHRWIHCLTAEIWCDAFLAAHDASKGKSGSHADVVQ